MLQSIYIQNYALISSLEIDFQKGFSTITGETGAGKSILLGALSLILGQRADISSLKDKSKKCIVEGRFDIGKYSLEPFFKNNELDYEEHTILRREISNDGKSRAFINDTPVNLGLLKEIAPLLIDIHSQHQNLALSDNKFQMNVVDTYASHQPVLLDYKNTFYYYRQLQTEFVNLTELAIKSKSDLDYFQFQFNQLSEANLKENEQEELEKELDALTHAEDIKINLNRAVYLFSEKEENIISQIKEAESAIHNISKFYTDVKEVADRLQAVLIEIKDISAETESLSTDIDHNPERVELINQRLDLVYSLQQKHRVNSISELINIRMVLDKKINEITSFDLQLEKLEKQIKKEKNTLSELSKTLNVNRKKVIPKIENDITELLVQLGMPNAVFKIQLSKLEDFSSIGSDKVLFLFSANKNMEPQDISKVASGGELSRLMLSIKYLIAEYNNLPTIIFDEIDTGVSGEIADKMGNIMKDMSANMQVLSITHLPQIAGKGSHHYIVYKKEEKNTTSTNIRLLTNEERINEIAKMLSGSKLTEAAISNAIELLNLKHS